MSPRYGQTAPECFTTTLRCEATSQRCKGPAAELTLACWTSEAPRGAAWGFTGAIQERLLCRREAYEPTLVSRNSLPMAKAPTMAPALPLAADTPCSVDRNLVSNTCNGSHQRGKARCGQFRRQSDLVTRTQDSRSSSDRLVWGHASRRQVRCRAASQHEQNLNYLIKSGYDRSWHEVTTRAWFIGQCRASVGLSPPRG